VAREVILCELAGFLERSGSEVGMFGPWSASGIRSSVSYKEAPVDFRGCASGLSVRSFTRNGYPVMLAGLARPKDFREVSWEAVKWALDILEASFCIEPPVCSAGRIL
jgi:hypothetical protein